jgi:uncharacterized membrane protein
MPRHLRYGLVALAAVAYVAASHWLMTGAPASAWNAVALFAPMLALAAVSAWRSGQRAWGTGAALALVALAADAALGGQVSAHSLYLGQHVAIHLFLAALFGVSLRAGAQPLIAAVAQRVHGGLTPAMARYTRGVTWAWTLYFVVMATQSAVVYTLARFETWATFANWLTPLALAAMFAGEHALRYRLHPEFERASMLDVIRAYTRRRAAQLPERGPLA